MSTEKLISYVHDTMEDELSFMQFYQLHRLNIIRMQNTLAIRKADIMGALNVKDDDLKALTALLHDYVNAIRDCEYMHQLKPARGETDTRTFMMGHFPEIARRNGQDPYNSQICQLPDDPMNRLNDPIRQFLKRVLPRFLVLRQNRFSPLPYHLRDSPVERVPDLVDQLARFTLAFVGGASLVIPMIIMTVRPSQVKSIATVSLAVVGVSFFMAVGFRCNNAETLGVTAAYAAVLVVFIGASRPE